VVAYIMTHKEYAPEREKCVNYGHVKWSLEVVAVRDKNEKCPELPGRGVRAIGPRIPHYIDLYPAAISKPLPSISNSIGFCAYSSEDTEGADRPLRRFFYQVDSIRGSAHSALSIATSHGKKTLLALTAQFRHAALHKVCHSHVQPRDISV